METIDPLVSVCLPTFNRAASLRRALESLLACSYHNIEIIVSDNASGDDTANLVREFSGRDARVKYFRHEQNLGPTKNFEFARAQASGKYFLWHADDDYLDRDYIRQCVSELEANPSLVLVAGTGYYYDPDGALDHVDRDRVSSAEVPLWRVLVYLAAVADNSIFCGVYRRNRALGSQLLNALAGDWAWVAEMLMRGPAKVLPGVGVHRAFGAGTSASIKRTVEVLRAPRWHAYFPWVAQCSNVASQVALRSAGYRDGSIGKRSTVFISVYLVLALKGVVLNLRALLGRVPYAKLVYKGLRRRRAQRGLR